MKAERLPVVGRIVTALRNLNQPHLPRVGGEVVARLDQQRFRATLRSTASTARRTKV